MAEKVILEPYPFPEGMAIPNLMPFQEYPWNGDGYLAAEALRLRDSYGLRHAFETGTCLGSTTMWLTENFGFTTSTEVNREFHGIAVRRVGLARNGENWMCVPGASEALIQELKDGVGYDTLCFLDAHWGAQCPLLDELSAIADVIVAPCIIIHDFQVPGTDFGFDKMPDGRPFNMDLIRGHLDRIYGDGGWKHNYPTQVEGARRGWISIEPA